MRRPLICFAIALAAKILHRASSSAQMAGINIWSDPEAADVVFRNGAPMWLVRLKVSRQIRLRRMMSIAFVWVE